MWEEAELDGDDLESVYGVEAWRVRLYSRMDRLAERLDAQLQRSATLAQPMSPPEADPQNSA